MQHNTSIIESLIAATLLGALFLAVRTFLAAKEPAAEGLSGLGDLEETLKKILAQAQNVPSAGSLAAAGAGADSQKLSAEISNLKVELEGKQKQIEDLKAATAAAGAAAAGSGLSEEEKAKMDAQLKELQAKLSEYEIISEDIADLSYYKEQNVKLQKEVEALKAGGAKPGAAPAAPTAAPAAAKTATAEPAISGKTKAATAEVNEGAPPPPPLPEPPPVAEVPAPVAASAPAAEAVNTTVDDDLLAEFNQAAAQVEPEVDLGAMDMDKMMAEAAEIKTDVPEVDPSVALGAGLDEDKLLKEATALDGVTQEDKKLMGEFENFVKKNE